MSKFGGILPAVVTPFNSEGRFNAATFERLLERLYAAGVHGVYVCGSTGEGLLQPVEQRKQVAEVAIKCSPAGKHVIVHVGATTTSDAIDLSKHAARIGAHAVSSLPPPGNYSLTEVKSYYENLAAASDVPVLIYFFPAVSSAISSAEQILELCSLHNVIGVKYTDYDLFRMSTIKRSGAVVFNGYDEVLVAGLLMGADGGIGTTYNLIPELFMQVYEKSRSGHWDEARQGQQQINELIRIVIDYPIFPVTKALLAWSGLDCGRCLPPRRSLTPTEEAQLRADLARTSFADKLLTEMER